MSWDQLKAIADENRALLEGNRSNPPTACPLDGALLLASSSGVLSCPQGNYRWHPGDEAW